jgi:sulfur-oxidizing protein SoxA
MKKIIKNKSENEEGSDMRMGRLMSLVLAGLLTGAVLAAPVVTSSAQAAADGKTASIKPASKDHPLEEIFSGYYFATPETRAMQDDDFDNPGMGIVEQAVENWKKVDGDAGKSCQSCHNDASASMKGVMARYPVYYEPWKKPINVEQRINLCREKFMKAKPYKYESAQMQGMTAYVGMQSRGMPVDVKVDGNMKPFFEEGKKFYYQRRGQLDMACSHCHENYYGGTVRSELLSQGMVNGFPLFRLKWQKMGSLHRRFAGCNKNIRAKPYKRGAPEYVNLELYVRWRGQGLTVETPGVRK